MILSFSRTFPWKDKTEFVRKIQEGIKQHTFRIGHRWKVGMKIHFWDQNPRSTMMTPKPKAFTTKLGHAASWKDNNGLLITNEELKRFDQLIPDHKRYFPLVSHIENWKMDIELHNETDYKFRLQIEDESVLYVVTPKMKLDCHGSTCPSFFLEEVAKRDGFDSPQDFVRWFTWDVFKKNIKSLSMEGQIIHWTNKIYSK